MNQAQQPAPKPIYTRPPKYIGKVPFEGDLFEREALAKRLTDLLMRLEEGCVIGIDAPWGDGKTWFGRNWQASLNANGFKTIYLDAFECDYSEDPFVFITAEILSALDVNENDERGKKMWEASKKMGKVLLPSAAKITVNALGRLLLGTADLGKEIEEIGKQVEEKAADATEKYIESRLKGHNLEKQSVDQFRNSIAEFAAAQQKPVIFFVDELDRCRPNFAVQVIERIKHFFDAPNLIFVLMLNREQLERAINGVYGQSVDAHAYLGKFVHLFFALPKMKALDAGQSNFNWIYCWEVANRYKLETQNNRALEGFINLFSILASSMGLSFRDVEKAIALLVMSNAHDSAPYLAWPIALKLKYPQIYSDILNNKTSAHQEAMKLLTSSFQNDDQFRLFSYFLALHSGHVNGFENLSEAAKKTLEDNRIAARFTTQKFLSHLLKLIDISIE